MALTLTELEKSSIGIIGGADGPTAIFVTGSLTNLVLFGIGALAVIAAATAFTVYMIKKHKKKP